MTSATVQASPYEVIGTPAVQGIYADVTLRADARAKLESPEALAAARNTAAGLGFSPRAMSPGSPNIYPVNAAGECTPACALGQEPIAAWQADFRFCSGV